MMIASPANSKSDRDLDCEASVEAEFASLAKRAVEAGWTEDEVANALVSLALTRAASLSDEAWITEFPDAGRSVH